MPTRLEAWSYSRLSTYEICPAKIRFGVFDKIKEPPNKAMERGSAVHKDIEMYLRGDMRKMTSAMRTSKDYLTKLRAATKRVDTWLEQKWGLDEDWEPCGFFDSNVWLRLVVDCAMEYKNHVRIIDFKTGKVRASHKTQLKLYAAAGFSHWDGVDRIECELAYIDHARVTKQVFTSDQHDELKHYFNQRTSRMLNDKTFDPSPSHLCNWCFYSKEKGGPCEY